MATGMNIPVKASKAGGTELIRFSRQKQKILSLSLAAGDDKNPFQDLGIKENSIFSIEDQQAAAGFKLEIERILKKFVGKIALRPGFPVTIVKDPEKGLGATFQWVDLETNDISEFVEFFKTPG